MITEKTLPAPVFKGPGDIFDAGLRPGSIPGTQGAGAGQRPPSPLSGRWNPLRLLALLIVLPLLLNGCALFSPGPSAAGKAAAKTAHKYIGVPYKLGGGTPKEGFDCSGLVQYVYARHGVKLPRSSAEQVKKGRKVRKANLQPGDLVFFATGKRGRVSHVGIYIGNDKFIHAPGRGKKTTKASLSSKYFKKTFHSARRVG